MLKYNHISKLELDVELLPKILKLGELVMRGLTKILELQILKKGSQTLRKVLDQRKEERKADNLLQTAGNINMEEHPNQGRESDIMDVWKKRLQETYALMNVIKDEIPENVDTFHVIADRFGAFVIPLVATAASHVLVVEILLGEYRARKPLPLVLPLFVGTALFSMSWYGNRIDGKQKVTIGCLCDVGKDAAGWSAQEQFMKVAKEFSIMLTTFHGRRGSVALEAIHCSSSRVTAQRQVMEQSFGEEFLCFRTLQRLPVADIWNVECILRNLNRSIKPTSLYYCLQKQFMAPSRGSVFEGNSYTNHSSRNTCV